MRGLRDVRGERNVSRPYKNLFINSGIFVLQIYNLSVAKSKFF